MKIINVLPVTYNLFPLSYKTDLELVVGDVVVINFRSKEILGIVWELNVENNLDDTKIKTIIRKTDFKIRPENIKLMSVVSDYYIAPLSSIAKLALPVNKLDFDYSQSNNEDNNKNSESNIKLNELSNKQQTCLENIISSEKTCVLYGVTGSGKTEVYFHLIFSAIKNNQQSLILLPEISLAETIAERFAASFGFSPIIWHSKISKSKKDKIFSSIINGEAKVVIGARSALFLPYKNLSVIVVDEEHDPSYKQDDHVNYNARDVAVLVGKLFDTKTLLVSATPSSETYQNFESKKYDVFRLESRYKDAFMPEIKVIDMLQSKNKGKILSQESIELIKKSIENNEQVLLFLNRKGYATILICSECGFKVSCKNCSVYLVLHKNKKRLECHHCGYFEGIKNKCRSCKTDGSIVDYGFGVEKLEEYLREIFKKDEKILTITSENINSEIISEVSNEDINLIIGTQVISKGYNFKRLNKIIIIDADGINMPGDIRGSEKNFYILQQVSGRAGRDVSHVKAEVYLQTYQTRSKLINYLFKNDFDGFMKYELETRFSGNMPPFSKMASLIISSVYEDKLIKFVHLLAAKKINCGESIKILGPTESLIYKINKKYRYRFLVITSKKFDLKHYFNAWFSKIEIPWHIKIKIDVDPFNFN